MNKAVNIVIASEDILPIEIAKKLLRETGCFNIIKEINTHGFGTLKKNIRSYHKMAHDGLPSLVLTDLDNGPCPSILIQDWLGLEPHSQFLFRITVRAIESWLLADRKGIADFLGIKVNKITHYPEKLKNPKQYLVNLARSGKRNIREEMVPIHGSTSPIGVGYNLLLTTFIQSSWNSDRAKDCSESLNRAIKKIETLYSISHSNTN